MGEPQWYVDDEGGFAIRVPAGWSVRRDPEEGVELADPDEAGVLHLLGFREDRGEPADPAEELYAFLDEQGIELQEDEVEDLELPGGAEMSICEFLSEEDEGEEDGGKEEATYWLMGVATAPGVLVFATYSCPAGEEEPSREVVRATIQSLRLQVAE